MGQDTTTGRALLRFELECRRYLADVGVLSNLDKKYSIGVALYLLCSSVAMPMKTIIVGERPYSTDIHPPVSSAMSYNPSMTRPTPSTVGVALDLSRTLGCEYAQVERWFMESWRHAASGTIVVNCTLFTRYSSSHSMDETIPFQKWIRCAIECSVAMGSSKVEVICMGVPAQNTVDLALRSMGRARSAVSKKTYPNPAAWSRVGARDTGSRTYTFGKRGTSQSILTAVLRSRSYVPLKYSDYVSQMNQRGAAQVPQATIMLEKAKTLVEEMEEAYKELEVDHRPLSLREAYSEFSRAMVEYRDSVLYDLVAASIAATGDNSSKVGRSTEWGSKKQWKKTTPSVGESSKMTVVSEDGEGIEQKFEEDLGEPVPMEKEADVPREEHSAEPPKQKKKKVVKRIVKRPKGREGKKQGAQESGAAERVTEQGSKLEEGDISVLRSALYYISEVNTSAAGTLVVEISSSVEDLVAKTGTIGVIVDTAARDAAETGKDASTSLGLSDGVVSSDCILPTLLNKLTLG
jgi:hypothetical protein